MIRPKITLIIVVVLISSCAVYNEEIMQPWLGASKDELVSKWGYPQSANDYFKINESTTVYSYRSYRPDVWSGLPTPCTVSFTIENDLVKAYKYEGSNCPRIER